MNPHGVFHQKILSLLRLPVPPPRQMFKWWAGVDLNHRHGDFQSPALPPELPTHKSICLSHYIRRIRAFICLFLKIPNGHLFYYMATQVGFEPTVGYSPTTIFKTVALNQALPLCHIYSVIFCTFIPWYFYCAIFDYFIVHFSRFLLDTF